ncbi:helix-turn-helix domain-containing protein [Providencia sp. PROV117]|uniref:helix-turn-helix domain-containing protein n=1 Tax=Providencia sp. PROV117 TaxID=2949828 RepID=UPI00234A1054|nr:helix-turn-helix domain-containing protein [Providencia sp. PROV117]
MTQVLQRNIINDILQWIEDNLDSKLSVDIVTQKSGYTKWHFQRLFKHHTGVTLGTYLRDRRLDSVAIALRETSDNIIDISFRYQFDSQQTLSKVFKLRFNMTPSQYRKRRER